MLPLAETPALPADPMGAVVLVLSVVLVVGWVLALYR